MRELRCQGPAPARRGAPGSGEGRVGGAPDGLLPLLEAHVPRSRCHTALPEPQKKVLEDGTLELLLGTLHVLMTSY